MSAWKIAIRRLHALGGVATTMQITEDIEAKASRYWPVERLRELGLIEPAERNGNRTVCRITPLGVAFVEGRAEVVKQPLHFRTGRRPEVVRMLEEAQ
jgi:hypothetical protein